MIADFVARVSRRLAPTPVVGKTAGALYRYYPLTRPGLVDDYDGNLKFVVSPNSYIERTIYWYGWHSRSIIEFLRGFLRKDMVVADVGANIGEITMFSAKRASKVLAFEPNPATMRRLRENIALNGMLDTVETFECGLYDADSSMQLFDPMIEDARSGVDNEGAARLVQTSGAKVISTVPVRRLDSLASSFTRLDLVKIDVEGSELMALKGGVETLRRLRPHLILEVVESNYQNAGYHSSDLLKFLSDMKYEVQRITPSGLDGTITEHCDVYCAPA